MMAQRHQLGGGERRSRQLDNNVEGSCYKASVYNFGKLNHCTLASTDKMRVKVA